MSSASVIGRCRMTVPAAAKMTHKIIRTTPVLIELRVCQILRGADRSDRAISFLCSLSWSARSSPTERYPSNCCTFNVLEVRSSTEHRLSPRHNTHIQLRVAAISRTVKLCDCNHVRP